MALPKLRVELSPSQVVGAPPLRGPGVRSARSTTLARAKGAHARCALCARSRRAPVGGGVKTRCGSDGMLCVVRAGQLLIALPWGRVVVHAGRSDPSRDRTLPSNNHTKSRTHPTAVVHSTQAKSAHINKYRYPVNQLSRTVHHPDFPS